MFHKNSEWHANNYTTRLSTKQRKRQLAHGFVANNNVQIHPSTTPVINWKTLFSVLKVEELNVISLKD